MSQEPSSMPDYKSRIDRLMREFKRAIKHKRPLISLAVYRSELVREDVEASLQTQLNALGQQVEHIQITPQQHDIPELLIQSPHLETTIFIIKGIQWGGGDDNRNAYRAFNFRREYIIENNIRMLLWLTESEAQTLAFQATDFWVFRHATVEFMDTPIFQQLQKHVERLTWQEWDNEQFGENTAAKIALREGLLADLPESDEALYERAELLYTLTPLYLAKQRYDDALESMKKALKIILQLGEDSLLPPYYNNRGITYRNIGQLNKALNDFNQAIVLNPRFAGAFYNRGLTYRNIGQLEKALNDFNQAIVLDPRFVVAFNNRGLTYRDIGQLDKALNDFNQALALNPQYAVAFNNRGATYKDMGQLEKALNDFNQALALNPQYVNALLNRALVEAKQEQWDAVLTTLKQALDLNPDEKSWVAEHKAFKPLLTNKTFQELVDMDKS